MADYSALSLAELKEEAKKRGLKGVSTMRKPELVELLSGQPETNAQEMSIAEESKNAPAVEEENEEPIAEITQIQEERRSGSQNTAERRPVQYQERGQAGGPTQRRQGAPSYVQQPRPSATKTTLPTSFMVSAPAW